MGENLNLSPMLSRLFVNLNVHGGKSEFMNIVRYKIMKYSHKFSQGKLRLKTSWVYLKTGHWWKNG